MRAQKKNERLASTWCIITVLVTWIAEASRATCATSSDMCHINSRQASARSTHFCLELEKATLCTCALHQILPACANLHDHHHFCSHLPISTCCCPVNLAPVVEAWCKSPICLPHIPIFVAIDQMSFCQCMFLGLLIPDFVCSACFRPVALCFKGIAMGHAQKLVPNFQKHCCRFSSDIPSTSASLSGIERFCKNVQLFNFNCVVFCSQLWSACLPQICPQANCMSSNSCNKKN